MNPPGSSRVAALLAVAAVGLAALMLPLETEAGATPEARDWDLYVNQMSRIAEENLSPVFQAVTQAANSFGRREDLQEFTLQLEQSKTELVNIQTLMAGLVPPVQLLEADHYIREGVQQLLNGMDVLIEGIRESRSQHSLLAVKTVTRGADFVVRGYGMLSEQSKPRPDLARKTP